VIVGANTEYKNSAIVLVQCGWQQQLLADITASQERLIDLYVNDF
jgi:hypothetical protein